jgi:hypothetical protein
MRFVVLCSGIFAALALQDFAPGPEKANVRVPQTNDLNNNGMAGYNRTHALQYAAKYWNTANHLCTGLYTACSAFSYWGGDVCHYPSHGGDCANFVSQCLVEAGHPYLNGGFPCRGYPCGKEEIGAKNLGDCLSAHHSWKRSCGHLEKPPTGIKVGDVLVYHASSCTDMTAHATLVTEVLSATDVRITCHSSPQHNVAHTYIQATHPYFEWLQAP